MYIVTKCARSRGVANTKNVMSSRESRSLDALGMTRSSDHPGEADPLTLIGDYRDSEKMTSIGAMTSTGSPFKNVG